MKLKVGDILKRKDGDLRCWLLLQKTSLSSVPSHDVWKTIHWSSKERMIETLAYLSSEISLSEFHVIRMNTETCADYSSSKR